MAAQEQPLTASLQDPAYRYAGGALLGEQQRLVGGLGFHAGSVANSETAPRWREGPPLSWCLTPLVPVAPAVVALVPLVVVHAALAAVVIASGDPTREWHEYLRNLHLLRPFLSSGERDAPRRVPCAELSPAGAPRFQFDINFQGIRF